MNKFGRRSLQNLSTCHPDLIRLFEEVIKHHDCSVLQGTRSEEEQDTLFHAGQSKVQYPNSKHNSSPSNAVDVAPYFKGQGIPWNDQKKFILFAGFVLGTAKQMGIKIRWGGDWNGNFDPSDQSFFDGPHYELVIE